jgi:hypothetical protein
MIFPALPGYKGTEWTFPSRDVNPSTKKDQYCMAWARAVYSLWCNGKTAFPASIQEEFETLRLYSRGEQDVEQYKNWLLGC